MSKSHESRLESLNHDPSTTFLHPGKFPIKMSSSKSGYWSWKFDKLIHSVDGPGSGYFDCQSPWQFFSAHSKWLWIFACLKSKRSFNSRNFPNNGRQSKGLCYLTCTDHPLYIVIHHYTSRHWQQQKQIQQLAFSKEPLIFTEWKNHTNFLRRLPDAYWSSPTHKARCVYCAKCVWLATRNTLPSHWLAEHILYCCYLTFKWLSMRCKRADNFEDRVR